MYLSLIICINFQSKAARGLWKSAKAGKSVIANPHIDTHYLRRFHQNVYAFIFTDTFAIRANLPIQIPDMWAITSEDAHATVKPHSATGHSSSRNQTVLTTLDPSIMHSLHARTSAATSSNAFGNDTHDFPLYV